jgi:predicted enzyme related to lactoylglutathione lyase
MDPVVHFEMPAEDTKRMTDFYATAFGWQMQMMGADMGNYVVVTTSEVDENGRTKTPGTIGGGFYPKMKDSNPYPSVVIAVNNIMQSIERIKSAGGKVLGEPVEIPGVGKYVSFVDTENNRLSILQPLMQNQ